MLVFFVVVSNIYQFQFLCKHNCHNNSCLKLHLPDAGFWKGGGGVDMNI